MALQAPHWGRSHFGTTAPTNCGEILEENKGGKTCLAPTAYYYLHPVRTVA